MKQKILSMLLLAALILVGCSTPTPAPEPVIDLSAYKADIEVATIYFCGTEEEHEINLADFNYIIPLNKFKPGCELESSPTELGDLFDIPGIQYNLDNVRTTGIIVSGDRGYWDYFYPVTKDGKEAGLAYFEGSGYIRYNGVVEEDGVSVNVNINVSVSTGWYATVLEIIENPPTLKLYQVPVDTLDWKESSPPS